MPLGEIEEEELLGENEEGIVGVDNGNAVGVFGDEVPLDRPGEGTGRWYHELGRMRDYDEPIFVGKAQELFAGRQATTFTASWRRDYTRRYRVIVNRPDVSPIEVCYAPGLPLPFSPYYPDPQYGYPDILALCTMMKAEMELGDDWQSWIVTVYYTTDMPPEGPFLTRDQQHNWNVLPDRLFGTANQPWEERPAIRWDHEILQISPTRDLNGAYFLNSANQSFTPAPVFEVAADVLSITRNEREFNRKIAAKYSYAVNQDIFLDADPGQAQCLPIRAEQLHRGSQLYWKVEIRIRFSPFDKIPADDPVDPNGNIFTWQPRILDCGTMQLNKWAGVPFPAPPNPNEPVPIFNGFGHPVTHAVLLDGAGRKKKPETAPGPNLGKILPVFLDFRFRRSIEFAGLVTNALTP